MPRLLIVLFVAANALAAGRELAPAPHDPSAYDSRSPSVAFAGGRFLTVWVEELGNAGARILGAIHAADGRPLSPRAELLVTDAWPRVPQLVGAGDSFALFFVDGSNTTHLADIDLQGRVTSRRVLALPDAYELRVAWNGTHFLAAGHLGFSDFAALLDRSGSLVRDPLAISVSDYRPFTVVAAGSAFFVIGPIGTRLELTRIDAAGLVSTRTVLDHGPTRDIAAAAREDGSVAVAWTRIDPDDPYAREESIGMAIIDAQGGIVKKSVIPSDLRLAPIQLMKTSGGFVLALASRADQRLHTMLLSDDAALVPPFPLHSAATGWGAAAAANGETMLLAMTRFDDTLDVQSRAIDREARIGGPHLLSTVPARQRAPVLGAGNGRAIAAFTEETGRTARVRVTAIAPSGQPLATRTIAADAALAARDVAWNGTDFLTAIRRDGKLYAARLTPEGELAAELTPLGDVAPDVEASVAWAGDHWMIVWPDDQELRLAVLTPNALVSSLRTIYTYDAHHLDSIDSVAIAFSGANGVIAWIQGRMVNCNALCFPMSKLLATRVSRDLTRLDAAGAELEVLYPERISVAASGDDAMVVADSRTRTVATMLGTRRTQQWLAEGQPLSSDVTWDGNAFAVASRGIRNLTVRRIAEGEARLFTSTLFNEADPAVSIISTSPGETIAGLQEASRAAGSRATVYTEHDLTELTRRRTARP